jgi:hypothetical protein
VYGVPVELDIVAEDSTRFSYRYTTNQNNTEYQVSNLSEGVYQYSARVSVDGVALTSRGNFTVRSLQIESLNLTANHVLLRNLAQENGGAYYEARNLTSEAIVGDQAGKGKIYTSELFLPLINLKWLFFLLLTLVAVEWGVRKYMGSY